MSTKSISLSNFEYSAPKEESLGNKALRWTAGRVAEIAKALIYTVGSVLMLTTAAVKLPIALVYTPIRAFINWVTKAEETSEVDPFTLQGVAKDLVALGMLVDKAAGSVIKAIFAPRIEDYKKSFVKTAKNVIINQGLKGGIHTTSFGHDKMGEVNAEKMLQKHLSTRDDYLDIILNRGNRG